MVTRIVIVDDDMFFSETIEKNIKYFYEQIKEPVSVNQYSKGSILLDELSMGRSYDIYFLDVEMPEIDGLELARRIKSLEADADIVFVSAYSKYAVPSYKIRACYYILKEEYKVEIPAILKRIRQECLDKANDYYIVQNMAYGKRMRMDDIMYLMREKNTLFFVA